MLPGGNAPLPGPDKGGLAELTASTLGDGSGKLDAQAVEKFFADRAASLVTGLQTFTISFRPAPPALMPIISPCWAMFSASPALRPRRSSARPVKHEGAAIRQRADRPTRFCFRA